jgi:C-terminal processing protease CtpA/Prc
MGFLLRFLLCGLSLSIASAQLTPDQRVFDFQNLAALYAKRYAPLEWKKQAFHFDAMNITPWLDRVRAAKDDLEFFGIQAEYVASLNDTHSGFQMTSSFFATLGITVDIYDGKVLIDSINRALLPIADYQFTVGDELVSVDGKTAEEWITLFSKWKTYGNPVTTRRSSAGRITVRSQSLFPKAVDIGDQAEVSIRRNDGDLETYFINWSKSGYPIWTVGPVPSPKAVAHAAQAGVPDYLKPIAELHNWTLPDTDPVRQHIDWSEDPGGGPRGFIIGQGAKTPVFRAGLPSTFVQRLGAAPTDFHFTGTYKSGEFTIGYIRIPGFAPLNQASAIAELDREVSYMQDNTDGLVVDVMRNNGGGCYMIDTAARLIPYRFYFFGEQIRATQDRLNSYQFALEIAKAQHAETWIIETYQDFVDRIAEALRTNRGMTDTIAACSQFNSGWAPVLDNNPPAEHVYTKPMIVLVDEFSISAADIFPAMIQDNGRAPIVGIRTSGGGGSVSGWPTGFYSESLATNTNSLVIRKSPIVSDDLPIAPYVENIGVRPDIPLDYMTRDNLINNGKNFVEQFTAILKNQIQKAQ